MGDEPARKFYSEMRRRNEFEEWGLEVSGGWADGTTWLEVVYVRSELLTSSLGTKSVFMELKLLQRRHPSRESRPETR